MQGLFSQFSPLIKTLGYLPKTAVEALSARLVAAYLLKSDPVSEAAAERFIQISSQNPDRELSSLKTLANTISDWKNLVLCSHYQRDEDSFIEYQLSVTQAGREHLIHRHARFSPQEDHFMFVDETPPLVRVIGDPVLHQAGIPFPEAPTAEEQSELRRQIELAKSILIATGGAGIAANQCAAIDKPYAFTIVGVFHDNKEHMDRLNKRYPGTAFPEAVMMINPKILPTDSQETIQFNHACLSVPSYNKCCVASPKKMSAEYFDLDSLSQKTVTFEGTFAVVLWHELNHIIGAKTYIDTALATLSVSDLAQFEGMVSDELKRRQEVLVDANLTLEKFYFTITLDQEGVSKLDTETLGSLLPIGFTTQTLEGFLTRIQALHEARAQGSNPFLAAVGEAPAQKPEDLEPC